LSFFKKFKTSAIGAKTDSDIIFSLSSAYAILETKLGLEITGKCALSIKDTSGMYFSEMKEDIQRFLDISKPDFELSHSMRVDKYGYLWIVLEGSYMDDILTGIAAMSDTIAEKGFSNQLLITAFEFLSTKSNNKQYLIYNYKLSRFYPFVPSDNKTRRIEDELKIMAAVADELPFERDMTLWYPIWELPF
jgi:hypothetical protein